MQLTESPGQAGAYQLFYRFSGEGEPVVLLHGIPTNSYLWTEVMTALSQDYQVIAPDLLGYGESDRAPQEELTLPKQAEHILALLDTLGINRAHFIGHDLGGGIAQILAVRYPQRVSSICVIDGVCFSNWPVPQVVAMRWPTAPEFEPSPNTIITMLRMGMFNNQLLTPSLLNTFTRPFEGPTGQQALQAAASALDHTQTEELVPYLSGINVPVTIVWGQYDRFLPAYWGQRLAQEIPTASFKILPGCGHYSMLDDPQAVSRELASHLQSAARTVQPTPITV